MTERAERRERRRLLDARFPIIKRLEEFRFADNPKVPQATIAALAEGSWIDDRESMMLVGESGTGKTMLATAPGGLRLPARPTRQLHHARRSRERAARSRQPTRARHGSSAATPAPSWWSWTNLDISPCPTVPPSSSSRSSPSATSAAA